MSFALRAARVRMADGSLVGPFDVSSEAARVGLIGAWNPLFELLCQQAKLESGSLEFGVAREAVEVAPLDPPLPPAWTSERYLVESGRLSGLPRRAAVQRARDTLDRFQIGHLSRRTLGSLSLLDRRVLVLVRATLSDPKLLCCEAPLAGLPAPAQALLDDALELAFSGRRSLVTTHAVPACGRERARLERCEELFTIDEQGVHSVTSAALTPRVALSVVVAENPDAFALALAERELRAERLQRVDAAYAFLYAHQRTECVRFIVERCDDVERKVFEASEAAFAPLLELAPL